MQQPFFGGGMATQDQLGFSLDGSSENGLGPLNHAEMQGRIYFLFTKAIDILLSTYPETFTVQALNLAVFSLSPLCFAYIIFRSNVHRLLFAWIFYSLSWQGFFHMPPAAYPVVNHLPFIAWAIFAWLIKRTTKRNAPLNLPYLALISAVSYFCFFQYESVALMALLVLPWAIHSSSLDKPSKNRLYTSVGIAAILYAITYVAWSYLHPSDYPGTEFGSESIMEAFQVFIAYTAGSIPFFGSYNSPLYLTWGDPIVGETLFAYHINQSYPFDIIGFLITLFAIIAMVTFIAKFESNASLTNDSAKNQIKSHHYWVLIILLIIAINGPIALSEKYQSWVNTWNDAYLTTQLALFPLCAGLTLTALWLGRVIRVAKTPVGLFASIVFIGICSYQVRQHNEQLATNFRSNLARWGAVSILAKASYLWNENTIVSPQLYFGRFTNEANWSDYWTRFVKKRHNIQLNFSPRYSISSQDKESQAIVRINTHDNGRLRAITVQTNLATFILSKKEYRPPMLYSDTGEGMPLNWRHAERNHPQSFEILKIDDAESFIGLNKKLSPAWSLPNY